MLSFFKKQTKHKQFGYIPMHYDPVKEEREARLAPRNRGESENSVEQSKSRISAGFKRKAKVPISEVNKAKRQSNIRLFVIIGILILLSYYFIQSDSMLKMLESLE